MGAQVDWDQRIAAAARAYPSLLAADFAGHLAHPGLLGDILRDLLRLRATDGTGRNRETPDLEQGLPMLQELLGNAYSTDPFPVALEVCTKGASIRSIVARTGLSRYRVHDLVRGRIQPEAFDLEAIAAAYHRPPEWFAAYRSIVLLRLVRDKLERNPERSAVIVRQLFAARR